MVNGRRQGRLLGVVRTWLDVAVNDLVRVQAVPDDRDELLEDLENERVRQPLMRVPEAERIERDVRRQVLLWKGR
jgi:hypothetical protein